MDHNHHAHHHGAHANVTKMAMSATLHCLFGCAIGEIIGLVVGTAVGMSAGANVVLAFCLSFLFGYTLSIIPLLRHGLPFKKAVTIILAADTLSILTMEIVDNLVMMLVPGAMGAGLANPLYWATMPLSFVLAFAVAVPVNRYLLLKGRGHALVHTYHH